MLKKVIAFLYRRNPLKKGLNYSAYYQQCIIKLMRKIKDDCAKPLLFAHKRLTAQCGQ